MKRFWSLVLTIVMIVPFLMACTSAPTAAPSNDQPQAPAADPAQSAADGFDVDTLADEIFAGVEPLETPTDLVFGQLSDSNHGFPVYFIEQIGGYKKVGINAKFVVFANGPVMVEALPANEWDAGTYGIGGILSGTVGHGALILGAATLDNNVTVVASNDSDIVKAGKNFPEYPELYGTAETWRGKNVYLPTGTTLHYTLVKGLERLGLTTDDLKITHMAVPTVATTLLADQAEVGGVWGNFTFKDEVLAKYTPVIQCQDVGADMITAFTANPNSYKDPVKKAAITKWLELYFKVVDWLYDGTETINQEKLDFFAGKYQEWNDMNGINSVPEEMKKLIINSPYVSLKQNYEMFHTEVETEDGKMSQTEFMDYDVLKFFVSVGNYQQEDLAKMLDNTHVSDSVDLIYELYK